jgi:hypothetical protein
VAEFRRLQQANNVSDFSAKRSRDTVARAFSPCLNRREIVKRIFLTLAVLANVTMLISLVLGLQIGDPLTAGGLDPAVNRRIGTHILIGLGALTGTMMVHALIFTYFMGTGRWLEETSSAYKLAPQWYQQNQKIKYGVLPGILISFLMVIATGSFGAIADPATAASLEKVFGIPDASLHFGMAVSTWMVTMIINFTQYFAIAGNSAIVDGVLAEVRRIRIERGLPVD